MKKLVLFLFLYVWVVQATNQKHQRVLDHLFANSTRHIFNVDDEHFLLKMVHENNQLMYRAVYPFNKIEQAGFYKLSTKVTGSITIEVDDVTLDLNGNTVAGGIVVNAGLSNIRIKNGTIDSNGSFGINFGSACSNCMVSDLVVKNGTVDGISCNALSNSVIKDCTFTNNMTGLALSNCFNITVQNCIASRNTDIGFELVSSVTCCLTDCQALSTGEGNVMLDGNIFGFVSNNGIGNIFERCIANATQGLTVTGFGSVVAGFGLLGSESCTKIIECESANVQTDPNGATISYGIYLEGMLDPNLTLTAFPPIPEPDSGGYPTRLEGPSGDFSPDGKYLGVAEAAAVGGTGSKVRVYLFDRQRFILEQVADLTINVNNDAFEWCPCGLYFATGENSGTDANAVRIFKFDPTNNTIVQVSQLDINGQIEDVSWSSDGRYLSFVLGAFTSTSPDEGVYVAEFNRVTETLSLADRVLVSNYGSIDFHPNRTLLAVGSEFGGSNTIDIYQFINNSLSLVESLNLGSEAVDVAWTPDGQYLAASIGNGDLTVYFFDNSTFTLTEVAFTTFAKTYANLNWDSDGKMLAVGHHGSGAPDLLEVYNFDRGSNSLQLRGSVDVGEILNHFPRPLWTPDGGYIAMLGPGDPVLALYTAFSFPSKNVIKDNTVYCNSGGGVAGSIGISGSSISNLIIGNVSYNNPVPQTNIEGGGPIVLSNYAFVTNIFDQNFGNAPTALQNLKFSSTDPIATPDDINIRLMRSMSKACDIQTKVDYLLTIYG